MFDHVTIRVASREASERFYDTVLATLGIRRDGRADLYTEWHDFSLSPADAGHPPTRNLHIGFKAPTRQHVDAFHSSGVKAGFPSDGAPGPRPQYAPDYYGGFLLDPDGNSAEAVHLMKPRPGPGIDHLWIRVADLGRARAFYELIAPFSGFTLHSVLPDRVHFAGPGASFGLVRSAVPTQNLHIAFPAADDATVKRFHATAIAAGHRDHGLPGPRPVYHQGYVGAFVLDPDGNNVEVVNHHR